MTAYAVGIVQLENCLKILGMIKEVAPEQIKMGMELIIVSDTSTATSQCPMLHKSSVLIENAIPHSPKQI